MSRTRLGFALMLSASAYSLAGAGAAQAVPLQVVGAGNSLVTVDSNTSTITRTVALSGVTAGQTIGAIDYRPATPRILYGLSSAGQLYAINGVTGQSVRVGLPGVGSPPINAAADLGFDFNPSVDRIRLFVPGNAAIGTLNYRLNPNDGTLAATDGVVPAGSSIVGAAYTNNVAGGTPTTLYGIDTRNGTAPTRLVVIGGVNGTPSPNTGTIGSSTNLLLPSGNTLTTTGPVGFDIATVNGVQTAYVSFVAGGQTRLYTINLTTGQTALLGTTGIITTGVNYNGLAVSLATFQSMGVTANQAAAGAALDQFVIPAGGTLATSVAGLFAGIDGVVGTPGAQSAALLQLTPAAYSQLPEIALNPVEVTETAVLRYTRDLRGNATMPDGSVATLDEAGRIGVWISGGSRFGRYTGATDRYGSDTDEFHFLGGADFRINPKTAIGGFYGYSKTNGNTAPQGGGKADLRSFFGGGYATAAVGPVYVDAWGSYTDLDFALERTISIGSYATALTARASKGRVWSGGASTGLSFSFSNFEIEPFVAFRYSDIRIRGFTEVGGGAGGLTIGDFDRVSARTNAGARVGTKFEIGGAIVRPQLRGGWYHEFRDQARVITAAFNTPGIARAFNFTTSPLSSDYYNAGGALNISGNGPLSFVADYDAQFDKDRKYYTMTIGARLKL